MIPPNNLERTTDRARFGAASFKATFLGSDDTNVGYVPVTLTALPHTVSAWVYIPADFDGTAVRLRNEGFGGGVAVSALADLSKREQWQRLSLTFTPTAGALSGYVVFRAEGASSGKTIFFDGVQVEQADLPTPYVETNGQAATRSWGRVQAPAALLDETQGWVAARLRVGFPSTLAKGQSLLDWRTDADSRFSLFYDAATSRWRLQRRSPDASQLVSAPRSASPAGSC